MPVDAGGIVGFERQVDRRELRRRTADGRKTAGGNGAVSADARTDEFRQARPVLPAEIQQPHGPEIQTVFVDHIAAVRHDQLAGRAAEIQHAAGSAVQRAQ